MVVIPSKINNIVMSIIIFLGPHSKCKTKSAGYIYLCQLLICGGPDFPMEQVDTSSRGDYFLLFLKINRA